MQSLGINDAIYHQRWQTRGEKEIIKRGSTDRSYVSLLRREENVFEYAAKGVTGENIIEMRERGRLPLK